MTPNDMEYIKSQFKSLHEKIKLLTEKAEKRSWVKVGFIMQVTGWDAQGMRKARENGLVKRRRSKEKGIEYLLESIPDMFIKNKPQN